MTSVTDVLVRGVPDSDLAVLKGAAAAEGSPVQAYLLRLLRAQADWERRQAALERIERRLDGGVAVPEDERLAVLDAMSDESA
jgi:hypothetical protein